MGLTNEEWWLSLNVKTVHEFWKMRSLNAFCVKLIKSDPRFSPHWLLFEKSELSTEQCVLPIVKKQTNKQKKTLRFCSNIIEVDHDDVLK